MNILQKLIRQIVAKLLPLVTRQEQPFNMAFWEQLTRLTITVAVETIALRQGPQCPEVLLVQRPESEPAYPGEWHSPGSIMRVGEQIEDVIKRLEEKEFGAKLLSYKFIANFNNLHELRGHFFTPVYLCEVDSASWLRSGRGTWFPVNQLPEKTLKHHRDVLIPIAVKAFGGE